MKDLKTRIHKLEAAPAQLSVDDSELTPHERYMRMLDCGRTTATRRSTLSPEEAYRVMTGGEK